MFSSAVIRKFCPLAVIAMASAACATDATGADGFDADTGPAATEVVHPRVVGQFTTDEHAHLTFYAESDAAGAPMISIEIESPARTPVLDAVLAQQPSALELFTALQPALRAPDELVREHQLLAQGDAMYSAEPRALVTASVAASNAVEDFRCVDNYAGWLATLPPALDGSYAAIDTGTTTGYVGYAPRFYFDVCRVSSSMFAYVVQTQRRSNSLAAWATFNSAALGLNQRYRFVHNSLSFCDSFQWRLYVNPVGGSYFRGASWATEKSCAITS